MTTFLQISLCLLISCAPARGPQDTKGKQSMESRSPFTINLFQETDGSIQAVLRNISDRPQVYLHHLDQQPSELVIQDARGDTVKPFDTRSIKKYDPTVYRAMYSTLQPRDSVILDRESFAVINDRTFTLQWLPFQFESLKAGSYSLSVRWECGENSWEDSETHEVGLIDSVWAGVVVSNQITIILPFPGSKTSHGNK